MSAGSPLGADGEARTCRVGETHHYMPAYWWVSPTLRELCVKAWRFYAFGDMRLDEVPEPVCRPGHVVAEPLCVQPSVTEAQLAFGIPTLAFEKIKRRLETEAPVQLFGHEFCARVLEVGEGVTRLPPRRPRRRAGQASVRGMSFLPRRQGPSLPRGADHRLSASRLFRRARISCPRSPWCTSMIGFRIARALACNL